MSEFHWAGVFFSRLPNGSVRIRSDASNWTIPSGEWESILAFINAAQEVYCPRCKRHRRVLRSMMVETCHNEFCAEPYKDILDGHGNTVIVSRDPVPGFFESE